MDGLRFGDPWLLLLLAPLAALALYAWRAGRGGAVRFGSLAGVARPRPTWRMRLDAALPVFRIAAAALLVFALARPQRGIASGEAQGDGIDIVLAFDVSSSMTATFAGSTSRLEAAKAVLTDFVRTRERDRVGLVAFQGSSITLSPLTTDYDALAQSIARADRLRLLDGTAIGTALGESVNVLRGSSAASRIVILLTDGENNAGEVQPLAAARIAERLGIRVYTVGVVNTREQSFGRGNPSVDEAAMRELSGVTGGTYSRAEDTDALAAVYGTIDRLETSRIGGRTFTRYDEMAPLLLAAAAAALAAEAALRSTLARRYA